MVYEPEDRSAFRLIPSAIVKKKSNGALLIQSDKPQGE